MVNQLEFPKDFIEECNAAFAYSTFIGKIMENLNSNNTPNIRSYMDVGIDELQDQINQPIGEGEEAIHNARVIQLKLMQNCWNKLHYLIDQEEEEYVTAEV